MGIENIPRRRERGSIFEVGVNGVTIHLTEQDGKESVLVVETPTHLIKIHCIISLVDVVSKKKTGENYF